MESIQKFLDKFEREIIERGVLGGVFTNIRSIPTKAGKLATLPFGVVIGSVINLKTELVVDYYGHQKKSTGFFERACKIQNETGVFPAAIDVVTVHFESVKDKHFHLLFPEDPAFLGHFFFIKQEIIRRRWGI